MSAQFPSWSPSSPTAVQESLRAVLASAWSYAEARLTIAKLESREALRVGLAVAAVAIIVLLSLIMDYVGAMLGLAVWIAESWGHENILAPTLVLVLGHLALAAVCALWAAHSVRRRRLFHATRKEFMEDKRWLQANQISKS
jgi:uncharacterized membrane protein YqjE